MVEYKWIALSNTSLGTLMASINVNITLVSLPAIFRGIGLNPLAPDAFQYLLWILFGYGVVTATLLVTFGRISDMFGRVRMYNLGFAIFTAGSILLFLTPSTGATGALELILFRLVQGVGASFIFSNSFAILTDAFPANERGKALGTNSMVFQAGSLVGLVVGGALSVIGWRYVFLVSVPVGVFGTFWSYWKLKEMGQITRGQGIDVWGNSVFIVGLTVLLVAVTYGLSPYGSSTLGWDNPWVVAGLVAGCAMLLAFPFVETRVRNPMFKLGLFRNRMFATSNLAMTLFEISVGGLMLILIMLLQGFWLPLHGYSYESTPLWSGIYLVPLVVGFSLAGPFCGWLSDRHGTRLLCTAGLLVTAASFVALCFLPLNSSYTMFGLVMFFMGVGNGMFISPNNASIMNAVPYEHRGAASGMRATLINAASSLSWAIFFTIIVSTLAGSLPGAFAVATASADAPQVGQALAGISPAGILFAAFLGYNPMRSVLGSLSSSVVHSIGGSMITTLESTTWFPTVVGPPFMSALKLSFFICAIVAVIASVVAALRGKTYIYGVTAEETAKS
jgi:MFS family permease